ncbi:T9SS type A sorting domain-containing protein [Pontibacter sp. BT310]|uniref:T9SS type A sorting domain-containing protein n=1 Tax=Pontibacter populi TaxID=890055 RepID=A0ABS6X8S2_9BACT|nr:MULTISPECIES: T9SS type A sorting domain-containing protein [Pontibacter]MBJ6117519.1 T9SS type A sorting domain-containing protein [Pontibacter sp. BT310]MBR0569944.1 T9SS type A sorting domain-containing protein [Microvirga sp. STS03]MBW3364372.1 T9SS type A sorting domain-containing protein [Pontibacter populi]
MKISTLLRDLPVSKRFIVVLTIMLLCFSSESFAEIKSWTGATSSDWNTASNWYPAGVPSATDDVIIDVVLNVNRYPIINDWNDYTIKSLTIGEANNSEFKMAPRTMTITGDVKIGAKGVLWNQGATAYYHGNFTVIAGGVYRESAYSDNNGRGSGSKIWPESEFLGKDKIIDIATTGSGFGNLTISNSIILAKNLNIIQVNAYKTNNPNQIVTTNRPELTISTSGILDPQLNQVRITTSTDSRLTPIFTVAEGGTLLVKAAMFRGNYTDHNATVVMFPTVLSALGVINYSGTINQDILSGSQYSYGVLRIGGTGTKTLLADSYVMSNLFVDAATLDIKNFTLNRTALGGTMNVANLATLMLSASNFPSNYQTVDLGSLSTVEYYGAAQNVADVAKGYGNLHLIGTGIKTMPTPALGAPLVIAGNLKGAGSASFTALSNINIAGNVDLSSTASFKGGTFTHTVGGNWINDADFTGNTSTIILTGTGKKIERTSTAALSATLKNEFNNLQVAGLGTTVTVPTGQNLTINGNLLTTGAGTLTQSANGLVMAGGTSTTPTTISGSGIVLNNLTIAGYTNTAASFLVNGNFATSSGGSFVASAGIVTMGTLNPLVKYTISHAGAGVTQFFNLTIARSTTNAVVETGTNLFIKSNLSGNNLEATAGTVTFNGSSTFGGIHKLNNVTITDGTTLTMAPASKMSVKGTFTGLPGNFIATAPNTVVYNGDGQTVNNFTYYHLELSKAGVSATKTAAGNITTLGTLTTESGVTLNTGNYTHTLYGDWVHNGIYSGASSNLIFAGTSDAKISGPVNAPAIVAAGFTVNKTAASVVTTEINITTNTLALTNGSMSTIKSGVDPFGASAIKVKVLGERSGSGWVNGTIVRKLDSGFKSRVDRKASRVDGEEGYAFNGEFAKIFFGTVSGVSEISMTTVPNKQVKGFRDGAPINRLYKVSVTEGSYSNATIQIQYEDSELNGNIEELEEGIKTSHSLTYDESLGGNWADGVRDGYHIVQNWSGRNGYTSNDPVNSLNNYFTLSNIASLFRWDGSENQAWETAGNWTRVTLKENAQGERVEEYSTPSDAPSISDIAELGALLHIHDPIISSNVSIKGLQFKTAKKVKLTINSGTTNAFRARGSLLLFGEENINHEIITGNQTFRIDGNVVLDQGNHKLDLSKTSGSILVGGSLTQTGSSVSLGSGDLFIVGDYIYKNNAPFSSTGTVTYNGGAAQIVADVPYNNLTINKTGGAAQYSTTGKTIAGNLNVVNGNLVLQSALETPSTITVNGDVTIGNAATSTSGTLNATNANIKLAGNWNRVIGNFIPGTGTVAFEGVAAQTITASPFNNLAFKNTSSTGVSLTGNLAVSGNVTLEQGTLNLDSFTMNRSTVGGVLTIGAGATLDLKGADNFPANFTASTIDRSSTVFYSGAAVEQIIRALNYGKLVLSNGNSNGFAKKLEGTTGAAGELIINSSAIFNANGKTLTISDNFINYGTTQQGGASTLILTSSDGTEKVLKGTAGTNAAPTNQLNFYNLIVQEGAKYKLETLEGAANPTLNPVMVIAGKVDIKGALDAAKGSVQVVGDFINTGILKASGQAIFVGTGPQTIQLLAPIIPSVAGPPTVIFAGTVSPVLNSTAAPLFGNVVISNTGGVTTSVNWTVGGVLTVTTGAKFHGGSYTHTINTGISNDGEITSSGVIDFSPLNQGAVGLLPTKPYYPLKFGESPLSFRTTGTLIIGGTEPVALLGVLPSTFNNLIISNKNAGSMADQIPAGVTGVALSTSLLPLYGYNGMGWNVLGNLTIESGSRFNAGSVLIDPVSGTAKPVVYSVYGNFTNRGTLNAKQSTFTFKGADSKIEGSGTTNFGILTTDTNSKLTINKNISVSGNLIHNGTAFNATNSTISFVGASPSDVSAPTGMAATPKVPLSLSNIRVAKDVQTTKVAIKSNVDKLLNVSVESGVLDFETSEVVVHPDVTETLDGVTSTTPFTTTIAALDGATIKVGGTSTLPAADIFSFAPTSTVEYYGGTTVNDNQVVRNAQYGNLTLSNLSTKTFESGHTKVAGNFAVLNEAKVKAPTTFEFNGAGAQTVAAINYNNLILSNTNIKTFAPGETGLAGSFTIAPEGTATADAITNSTTINYNGLVPQSVLPINYYNLTLSGSEAKSFTSETGIANIFVPGTGLANTSAAGNTITFNGLRDQKIPGLAYKNLKVSGSGTKTLLGNAIAEESLMMEAGTIATSSFTLTLANTATIVDERSDSYVVGRLVTTRILGSTTAGDATNVTQSVTPQAVSAITETFGNIGLSMTPVVGNPGEVKVTRVTGAAAIVGNGKNVQRYFLVEPTTTSASNRVNIEAIYLPHEVLSEIKDEQGSLAFFWSDTNVPTSNWRIVESSSATEAVTNQRVSATNVGQAGYFTLGSRITPLPVELLSFTATKKGNNAELKWTTATEQNNQGFEVQVSVDGKNYERLGFVESRVGSSAMKQEYSFTDARSSKNGVQYYRLKQIDFDGTSKIYGPKTVNFGDIVAASPSEAYPNPFKDKLRVNISTPERGVATIKLYTATGRLLKTEALQVEAGVNDSPLSLANTAYEPGLYLLVIELNGKQQTIKLMKE